MPIYAFACTDCGHQFDRLQKLSDPDPEICPDCAAKAIKRQLTMPAFRLAGSGWYETDFKKGGDRRNLAGDSHGNEGKPQAAQNAAESSQTTAAAKPAAASPSPSASAKDSAA